MPLIKRVGELRAFLDAENLPDDMIFCVTVQDVGGTGNITFGANGPEIETLGVR